MDLHRIEPTGDGGGDQVLEDGRRYHYGPPVHGTVNGQVVACCSVDQQIDMHLGYEPRDKDRGDLALLATEFEVQLPPPYAEGG